MAEFVSHGNSAVRRAKIDADHYFELLRQKLNSRLWDLVSTPACEYLQGYLPSAEQELEIEARTRKRPLASDPGGIAQRGLFASPANLLLLPVNVRDASIQNQDRGQATRPQAAANDFNFITRDGVLRACEGESMSTLIAVVFHDESTAFEMRAALAKMQKQYLLDLEDTVVVTRDLKGKVKLDQAVSMTASGAASGAFWGMLIGLLFFNPILGAAVGAGAGALSGKLKDIGVDGQMAKQMGEDLTPGSSALIVLLRKITADKVLDGLKQFAGKGRVFQTSLSKDDEKSLREVLETPPQTRIA